MAFQDPDGQAARPPRRRRRWPWIVGGIVAFFVVVGIIGAATDSGKKDDDAKPAPAGTVAAPSESAAASKPAPEVKPSAAVKPKPKAKPVAKVVLSESGSGVKSTAKFHVDGDWDLKYSYDCADFGMAGNFIVKEGGNPLGELYLNELGKGKSDVTHLHDGGTRFLEVNSTCSWKIDVIDVP
ncbi:hypothetical protein AB0M57_04530 [Streptomyces sp. NPDC051597]|uniref:hypothetical protein n=1 Tax=Streptomyces sp. NPDC051597 TaxID=3155049 RepID=UPI0034291420